MPNITTMQTIWGELRSSEKGRWYGRFVLTNASLLVFLYTMSLFLSLHLMPLLFYMTVWPPSNLGRKSRLWLEQATLLVEYRKVSLRKSYTIRIVAVGCVYLLCDVWRRQAKFFCVFVAVIIPRTTYYIIIYSAYYY